MPPEQPSRRRFLAAAGTATLTAAGGWFDASAREDSPLHATPAADAFDGVVDAQWLEERAADVAVLDVRADRAVAESRIESALGLSVLGELADHEGAAGPPDDEHRLSFESFAAAVESVGVEPADDVVVYGDGSLLWEAYGVYALRAIDHDGAVALLDGGFPVWEDVGGAVETDAPATATADALAEEDGSAPERYDPASEVDVRATREDVAAHVDEDGADVQLVDNRSPAEYYGLDEDDDRFERHGHVTGAINVHFTQNLDAKGRRLRDPDELERLWFDETDLDPTIETISYCVSGVRASVGWFLMDQLGWSDVRNYEGSWLDWGNLSEADGYHYTTGEGTGTVVDPFR